MEEAILIVEDEAIVRRHLALFLRIEGYAVADTDTGASALNLMTTSDFDAVISDFHLRNTVSGFDVLSYFDHCFPGRAKILVSGTSTDLEKRCDSIGALFIHKPLRLDELLSKLKTLLAERPKGRPLTHAALQKRLRMRQKSDILRNRSYDLQRRSPKNFAHYNDNWIKIRQLPSKITKKPEKK